ncbi:MAG: hypothetical protein R3315_01295 [Woeseiaceae bacterium]|nr:hypothetical protein [Woeseiaceae bacterium]
MNSGADGTGAVRGEFIDVRGERYYAIRNVDRMPPFFISVISDDDHWLFASSNGGLTAGRISPDTALFPYVTVDKIHDSTSHTGSLTMLRVRRDSSWHDWDPFGPARNGRYDKTRNLYKNTLGNKLCFEEINHDLDLAFRYTWQTSDRYGFIRSSELENLGEGNVELRVADGLQNVLPAGTPRFTQTNSSNLVDAYKWTEYDAESGLVLFTLYSGITDRAEPCESLRANVAYCLGLDEAKVLMSTDQLRGFRRGRDPEEVALKRGVRGAFIVDATLRLEPGTTRSWQIVANTDLTQREVVALRHELTDRASMAADIRESIRHGSDTLARIAASGDGFQQTDEEAVATHHYANVVFNILRGGVFHNQYTIDSRDLRRTIRSFNRAVFLRNRVLLDGLPDSLTAGELLDKARESGDLQLQRLCYEYLPITFGRRHGDPSRPWNQFAIRIRDAEGKPLLSYQGNWRDIFQNWEALAFSFPEFVEGMIAKFVNASTVDGYNPYRITKEGIDWEVEDPDDPWSYIGYWGDHQIIYLQKLLELSQAFHPDRLPRLLREPIFSYANVPYRIRPFDALLADPKHTVDYDSARAERIEASVEAIGADGKLLLDGDGAVYQVNLVEKLLVPLLSKLGNLVIDGGIWMNTQRPEWNDANNALVGHGLSMVTLNYLRRYVEFLRGLLAAESGSVEVSAEVVEWLTATAAALRRTAAVLDGKPVDPGFRRKVLRELGEAASRYRGGVYEQASLSGTTGLPIATIDQLLGDALAVIDHNIGTNRRDDGLYHAYNLLDLQPDGVHVERLYPMLEGQVAALSAGVLPPETAIDVVEALFASDIYRPDQDSFMLYPDRELPGFLDKNRIPDDAIGRIPLLTDMLARDDTRLVERDADGVCRFNADFANVKQLLARLDELVTDYGDSAETARAPLKALYEDVFNHQAFTGRSGTMFGFEGLGCIYWHMVAKLMLAVQDNFYAALDNGADPVRQQWLGQLYYRIRDGMGFNKTPGEYGAFPCDPYSHTPKHAGAQQPGMTGQVKEEVLTRFGELGVRVADGCARLEPRLLRAREFLADQRSFRYLDVDGSWQEAAVPARGLAFSWCQVPFVYRIDDTADNGMCISFDDGRAEKLPGLELTPSLSAAVFERSGRIRRVEATIRSDLLFHERND